MAAILHSLLIISFISICLPSGEALKCWTCDSNSNSHCGDPFNLTQQHQHIYGTDCERSVNEWHVCKKIIQKENGKSVVRRSCELATPEERDIKNGNCPSHHTTHSHVTVESCQICNSDYCNAASSLSASKIFFLSAIVLIASRFVPAIREFSF